MPAVRSLTDTMSDSRLAAGQHPSFLPVAAVLAAVFFWSGSFVAMRVTVQVLNPWSVMWLRMAIALVVLLPFLHRSFPLRFRRGDWKRLILMVLFQPCFYFLLESNALRFTTSSQAGVISASVPLLVALGAWLCLRESLNRFTALGLFLAMTGVVVLTISGRSDVAAANPLWGNALELAAMACAAANMLLVKELCRRYNPWSLTALQVIAGSLFFSPGLGDILQTDPSLWTSALVWSLLFLGAFVTLGAFGLYNWAMSRMPASRASAFINLVPMLAVLLGWLVLNEGLNHLQLLAAMVIVGGVILSQRR